MFGAVKGFRFCVRLTLRGIDMAYIRELKVTYKRKRVDDDLLGNPVQSPKQVYDLFKDMQDETKEKVVVLHLNPQLEILSYEVAALGTAHRALIDPVEIFRNAILARASSLIVVHNHPSGNCQPSQHDFGISERLNELGKLHEILLQDFIVIGFESFYSFKNEGCL